MITYLQVPPIFLKEGDHCGTLGVADGHPLVNFTLPHQWLPAGPPVPSGHLRRIPFRHRLHWKGWRTVIGTDGDEGQGCFDACHFLKKKRKRFGARSGFSGLGKTKKLRIVYFIVVATFYCQQHSQYYGFQEG